MRKGNALLSVAIIILFLVHAVLGGMQLIGIMPGGSALLTRLAWVMTALVAVHALIGIKLTADSIFAGRKAGVSYLRENKSFWARRISGFAILLFLLVHVLIFNGRTVAGAYRLSLFAGPQLASQILLVLSIAVHVITNVKPSLIALGIRGLKEYAVDILVVLSVVLLFMGAAFVVYYLRWM